MSYALGKVDVLQFRRVISVQRRVSHQRRKEAILAGCKRRYTGDKNYRNKIRSAVLKRTLGIDFDRYAEILKIQNGKCAICQSENTGRKRNRRFAVDPARFFLGEGSVSFAKFPHIGKRFRLV
ncbi:MAG: hypothetical protein CMM45_12445 [Rhodospirillaceae bacterium]|nr:hypothetical protein [Rhodospirillaceae bacterium]